MALTRVRVFLHNETDDPLALVSREVVDGDWTTGPPDRIEPRSVAVFGSEADGLDPDTEGRATYQIGDDPASTLYVHWNDAVVGGNAFHTNTDDAHYAWWTATPGNHCDAHFVLRDAGTVTTDFLPSRDAFFFANSFGEIPYSLPPLRGSALDIKFGNAKDGLCGGMVFAALDYFFAGWRIPAETAAPEAEHDPMFSYLVDRLFATFSLDSVSLMLALINPAYPDGDENMMTDLGLAHGRAAVMAHEEWPLIRADIDAGRPAPMFITTVKSLNPFDLGKCHQVLAYAYDAHGHDVTIHVYDPNTPDRADATCDLVQLSFNDGDVSQRIVVTHNVDVADDAGVRRPIYCFGRMDYAYREPVIRTEPRLTGTDVDRRGISVTASEPVTESSTVTGDGEASFDIGPDCGVQTFRYTEYAQAQVASVVARPHGYYQPQLTWRVGGQIVDQVVDGLLETPAIPELAEDSIPVDFVVTLSGDTLTLRNRPADGNYAVAVEVTCVETGEADEAVDAGEADVTAKSWTTTLSFTGVRRDVPGLSEAIGQCMKNYLEAHRAGAADAAAELAAVYAQLRRPPDPLWDPDPALLDARALVAAAQPDLADLAQASQIPEVRESDGITQVTTSAFPTGVEGVTVGHGTAEDLATDKAGTDKTVDATTLTEEEIAKVREKTAELSKEIGGFTP